MLHLLLAGLCAFSRPTDPPCGDQSQGVVALVDVTVIPMDRSGRLPGQTVVVRGDRIVELGLGRERGRCRKGQRARRGRGSP